MDEILSLMSVTELMRFVGEKIRRRRRNLRMSRRELAERSGVSQSTIKRLEADGIATVQVLVKVAIALGSIDTFEHLFAAPKARTLEEFCKQKQAEGEEWRNFFALGERFSKRSRQ